MTEEILSESLLKKTYSEQEIQKLIKKHIDKLGNRAPAYGNTRSVEELRAYFRMFLEPYLRDLKNKGVIKNFLIGISTASSLNFFRPQVRIILPSGDSFIYPLNLFLKGNNLNQTKSGLVL